MLVAFGISDTGSAGAAIALGTVLTLAVIGCASMFRAASLRTGGSAVAHQFGATPVPEDTTDFNLRRLRNVVEEIAIASSVPVPQIFVLDDESAINAFAAGYAPSDAAIAVTRGALNRLNRDELQGVIAHEFSHVLNGDMRLNIRLIGLLFGILVLALIGRKILQHGRFSRSKDPARSC
jgi:Zn-dependent protease with chaperone function